MRQRNECGYWQCARCKQFKEDKEYTLYTCSKSGLYSYCSDCRAERARERNLKKNPNFRGKEERARPLPSIPENAVCTKCRCEKNKSEFHKQSERKDGIKTTCKDCDREIDREQFKIWQQQLFDIKREAKCKICGLSNPNILQFHHMVYGSKEYRTIGVMTTAAEITRKKELEKCVVLCANHHLLFHALYGQKNFPDWSEEIEEILRGTSL